MMSALGLWACTGRGGLPALGAANTDRGTGHREGSEWVIAVATPVVTGKLSLAALSLRGLLSV